jgi:hypothetical protein
MGVASGAEIVYPSGAPAFTPSFSGVQEQEKTCHRYRFHIYLKCVFRIQIIVLRRVLLMSFVDVMKEIERDQNCAFSVNH